MNSLSGNVVALTRTGREKGTQSEVGSWESFLEAWVGLAVKNLACLASEGILCCGQWATTKGLGSIPPAGVCGERRAREAWRTLLEMQVRGHELHEGMEVERRADPADRWGGNLLVSCQREPSWVWR